MIEHSSAQELSNVEKENLGQIKEIEKIIAAREIDNEKVDISAATKITELKAKIKQLKTELENVKKSIRESEEEQRKKIDQTKTDFIEKKNKLLKESKEIENKLNHYAEWQKQSEEYKSQLSEIKFSIHQNRISCNENINEARQNIQTKMKKHQDILADAIKQARAEALHLQPGDISNLTAIFLTQSEAHLQSLNSQLESTNQMADLNQSIEEENNSLIHEIEEQDQKNQELKDQEEEQNKVLSKLRAVKSEFQEKERILTQRKKKPLKTEHPEKKNVSEQDTPKKKKEFKLTQEHESFITFLNECSTFVRSVLIGILHESPKNESNENNRFEAPKLSSMITQIKEMSDKIDSNLVKDFSGQRPILTPAAAYFAFSAPFDESDNFIESENWSFAKYESYKSNALNQQKKNRLVKKVYSSK
ncbi:hypothetical protein GPJ56_005027 [Histomonas meleagridis]|uniref:uncharacterized protein n=1 Tax=Histomonas meleagridis TaxID=135588 RepID=UPI00355A381F|nr:hypothetical protein GPJ56_005027 [Histomonas meleagridis]KAH0802545.1 hypothetical protein GO595_004594 [Histomonas meleagridis]